MLLFERYTQSGEETVEYVRQWHRTVPKQAYTACRIKITNRNEEIGARVRDVSPYGCQVELKQPINVSKSDDIELLLKDDKDKLIAHTMRIVGMSNERRHLHLESAERLPIYMLGENDSLQIDAAELEILQEHAQRMWDAEHENFRRLTLRGRVIVASTAGLLGFVAIGMIVAGADSRVNLIAGAASRSLYGNISLGGTAGIALGLLVCISAVIIYIVHGEEDSGVLDIKTDFGPIGEKYFDTQPNMNSVCASYLYLSVFRQERGIIIRSIYHLREYVLGFSRGTALRYKWSCEQSAGNHVGPWRRRFHKSRSLMWTIVWTIAQATAAVAPGIRQSRFIRRSLDARYRMAVEDAVKKSSDARSWIQDMLEEHDTRKRYTGPHAVVPELSNPRHPRTLAGTASYYLQFSEGFASEYLGRVRPHPKKSPYDPKVVYFDLDSGSPKIPSLRSVGWRAFISTYFASQQFRSANWNLWFRVRKSERVFAVGLAVIAISFVVVAIAGAEINKIASPVAPIEASVDFRDGKVSIKHNEQTD